MEILCLDVGTIDSAYCLIDNETYRPLEFGKIDNNILINKIRELKYDVLVYEEFQSYGMPIGQSTMESIKWNGRYIQIAYDLGKKVSYIYRKEEKMNLCHSMKAKDSNIRQALIDRFGPVGTKGNPRMVLSDSRQIFGQPMQYGITYLDKLKGENQ